MAGVARPYLDFVHRHEEDEWLDRTDLDRIERESALRDLASFNRAFLGHYSVFGWLRRAIKAAPEGCPLTIVDVGCGYGDLLRSIRRWARRQNRQVALLGIDLNPENIRIARAATDAADRIEFQVMNVFDLPPTMTFDFIISSLVAHHLSDHMIIEFLSLMEKSARRGWLIYDLQRHRFLYHFIGVTSRLMRLHPMVVHDGQVSVTRSLTRSEWEELISAADIPRGDAVIRWFFFRFLIGRLR